jgi:hypothetical protein
MSAPARLAIVALAAFVHCAVARASQDLVLQKEGTSLFHRPWCEVVRDGKNVLALSRGQAHARGLKPHAECDRDRPPEPAPGAADKTGAARAARVFVFVGAGSHYHRDGCARLGRNAKKLSLDEAGRRFWPCPTCKPPIRKRRS